MRRRCVLTCLLALTTGCSAPGATGGSDGAWPKLVPLAEIDRAAPDGPAYDPTQLQDRAAALKARAESLQNGND